VAQVIAHRGASRAEPENTIAAFERAASMGAHAVELDVRRTRDGVLVVHHDPRLPGRRVIAETTAHDLPDHVPTVGAALDACRGMWVNVEIKNDPDEPDFDVSDSIADDAMQLLAARPEPMTNWLISSFRMQTIDRCRAVSSHCRTAWLTTDVPTGVVAMLAERGHEALHPSVHRLTAATIEKCHEAGIAVNTWTCDDPQRMAELVVWGIDGICTNVPDVALEVIARSPS
jgi:glycerophosphoryl diester phosphodiesterase